MHDPERRLRQLLARHIEYRAAEAAGQGVEMGACYQAVALVRLWQAAGEGWDQPEAFGRLDHLMADYELGAAVTGPAEQDLRDAAHDVAEAARTLS